MMRPVSSSLRFLFLFSTCINASESDSLNHNQLQNFHFSTRSSLIIRFDRELTMRSGAHNIITAHNRIVSLEDKYIGARWFTEKRLLGKTFGVSARMVKYALIDLPTDYFSVVLAHEYFGHGARYRDQKIKNVDYGYEVSLPYGNGGGWASVNGEFTNYHELLAIWLGGVEIHPMRSGRKNGYFILDRCYFIN